MRTVLPKEMVEHADKEFLLFPKTIKGIDSLHGGVQGAPEGSICLAIHQARFCSLHLKVFFSYGHLLGNCAVAEPCIPTQPSMQEEGLYR